MNGAVNGCTIFFHPFLCIIKIKLYLCKLRIRDLFFANTYNA